MRRMPSVAILLLAAGCGPASTPITPSSAVAEAPLWIYSQSTDEMNGSKTVSAAIESTDTFAGHYDSDQEHTTLRIIRHGKSTEVAIVNPNLQFTCSAYTGTYVQVKFDDGPASRFRCVDESTDKYGVAFITNEATFIKRLKSAHGFIIGADVFQRGEQRMHFTNPGLTWPPTSKELGG